MTIVTDTPCRQPPGLFQPRIDRKRCEGKGPCVDSCPQRVLALGRLSREQRRELSLVGRLKAMAHGGRQAIAVAAERCQACGACVRVCPERAITLQRRDRPPTCR
jgi:NAD-dependent dihydropyrimidine dehydrogenase PreA subunit